jgi:Radial spoke protein 3
LEIITGKVIEQARIEVIEEHENELQWHHVSDYELRRDNDLIEVQRLDMERQRKIKEQKMRDTQQELRKKNNAMTEKRLVGRSIAKSLLMPLKNSTLSVMREAGMLKTHDDEYIEAALVPSLYTGAHTCIQSNATVSKIITCNCIRKAL